MSRIGVTVGKFMPMHKGHELMIETAAAQLDELVVIVSSSDHPSLDKRYNIIKEKYKGRNIQVFKYLDTIGDPAEVDEYGTAIDDDFWSKWIRVFDILAPDATHFVSSDRYGKEAARRLEIEWFAVDPDRELFSISATEIRKDPRKNWKWITDEFRNDFVFNVTVVGAESSGKSTLVKDLGKAWNSPAVPEYGRIMTEIVGDGEWNSLHFYDIIKRQTALNQQAAKATGTGIIFVDTEAMTTHLYADEYLKDRHTIDLTSHARYVQPIINLLVIVEPNLEWVDDGTRIMPSQEKREEFVELLKDEYSKRYYKDTCILVLSETDRQKRIDKVSSVISSMIGDNDEMTFEEIGSSFKKSLSVDEIIG